MEPLHFPLTAAVALLVPAGVMKLARPVPTERALHALRWPGGRRAVRALGAYELAAAAVTFGAGGAWALSVAVAFGGFTVFVLAALASRVPIASCGCFGSAGAPPDRLHVAVTAALAISALVAALDALASPWSVLADGGGDAAALGAGSAALAVVMYLVLNRPARPGT